MAITIHIITKSSLFNQKVRLTKSAMDKNFNAKASSINPKTTLVVFSHPPDLGIDLSICGKRANAPKISAHDSPNPEKAEVSLLGPLLPESEPNKPPKIGPVQEKETITRVSAIKNTPTNPLEPDNFSDLASHDWGTVSS